MSIFIAHPLYSTSWSYQIIDLSKNLIELYFGGVRIHAKIIPHKSIIGNFISLTLYDCSKPLVFPIPAFNNLFNNLRYGVQLDYLEFNSYLLWVFHNYHFKTYYSYEKVSFLTSFLLPEDGEVLNLVTLSHWILNEMYKKPAEDSNVLSLRTALTNMIFKGQKPIAIDYFPLLEDGIEKALHMLEADKWITKKIRHNTDVFSIKQDLQDYMKPR